MFFAQDLVSTIKGYIDLRKLPGLFKNCTSKLLLKLTQHQPTGEFADFEENIKFFKVIF